MQLAIQGRRSQEGFKQVGIADTNLAVVSEEYNRKTSITFDFDELLFLAWNGYSYKVFSSKSKTSN